MSRELARLGRLRDTIIDGTRQLTDARIGELLRRAELPIGADGFPSGHEGRGGEESTTVEVAALAGLPSADSDWPDDWNRRRLGRDEVMEAKRQLRTALDKAAQEIGSALRAVELVEHIGSEVLGRVSEITQCQACERTVTRSVGDRLRSGYCEACYKQWQREGRPERHRYERRRRDDESVEATSDVPTS